jgi:hypothetical protein
MKTFQIIKIVALVLPIAMIAMMTNPLTTMADQPAINLGTAESFAVLAGMGIINSGTTIINGDAGGNVGSDPADTFTGQTDAALTGATFLADVVSLQAKKDLLTAYYDIARRGPVTTISTELGGQTLSAGVYDSASGTFELTGTLALDAQGDPDAVFIFKTANTLTTAACSNIQLLDGATHRNVYWQIGSTAILGPNSHFVGHLFALTSITANTGASVQGQLLACNGVVTLDANAITNGFYATVSGEEIAETTQPTGPSHAGPTPTNHLPPLYIPTWWVMRDDGSIGPPF